MSPRASTDAMPTRTPGQPILLARHFFNGFFDNESVAPQGGRMSAGIAKILALLAAPGMACFWLFPKYTALSFGPAEAMERASLEDKLFLITFSMAVMGFVTILEWDAMFPDRRDFAILIPLPIAPRSIFAGKILALGGLAALFFAATNAISAALFPLVSAAKFWRVGMAAAFFAHLASVSAATLFVFLFFLALQGLLMNALGRRAMKRLSAYFQLAAVFGLLATLLLFFDIAGLLYSPARMGLLYYFPPAWFLGIYELLLKQPEPLPGSARMALEGLGAAALAAAAGYALSYKRHMRRLLESEEVFDAAPTPVARALAALADRFAVRRPVERACFHFIGKTILRSRKHWLYLAAYAGVGFAFALQALPGALSRPGPHAFGKPTPALLSAPLALSFFLLAGMRYIFSVPAELKANWIFRLSENEQYQDCLSAARKAMLWFAIVPLYACLFPAYALLWGFGVACFHALFGVALSIALAELLLVNFRKIPFTCSYLPGNGNLNTHWFFYYVLFSTYAYSMSALEFWILGRPARMVCASAACAALIAAAGPLRRSAQAGGVDFVFEETLEPAVRTLNLSAPGSWRR